MARPIDEKIAALKLDTSDLERKAPKAVGMFAKLQEVIGKTKNLDMSKSIESLGSLKSAGDKITLENLAQSVDAVTGRFSNLGIMAITALQNITNRAIDAGITLAQSFTTKPLIDGFREYELKMGSVQTILSNTQGKNSLEDVNNILREMNDYADQTIYNFAEMTRNIGTFTAAGVDLETSAMSIKGIANLAAASGSNSQQASTAMYQLSQAIAAGSVKLQDWNSVVNAGMGGKLFQDALIETANNMGIANTASENFRESLQEGWITTEVLTETLRRFSEDESMIEAATKVRTFTQLVDTAQEAVGSGWATTWELVFGDFEKATEMWSGLSNVITGFIDKSSDVRNAFIKSFVDLGGRDKILQSFVNLFKVLSNLISPVSKAFNAMFPPASGKLLYNIVSGFELLTRALEFISRGVGAVVGGIFKVIFGTLRGGINILKAVGNFFIGLIPKNLPATLTKIANAFKQVFTATRDLAKAIVASEEFKAVVEAISDALERFAEWAKRGLTTAANEIEKYITFVSNNIDKVIPKMMTAFEEASKWTKDFVGKASVVISDFANVVSKWFGVVGDKAKEIFQGALGHVETFAEGADVVGQFFKDKFGTAFEFVKKVAETLWDVLQKIKLEDVFKVGAITGFVVFGKKITEIFEAIKEKLLGLIEGENSPISILDKVTESLSNMVSSVKAGSILAIAAAVGIFALSLKLLEGMESEDIAKGLGTITLALFAMTTNLKKIGKMDMDFGGAFSAMLLVGGLAGALVVMAGALKILETIDPDRMGSSLLAMVTILGSLTASLSILAKSQGNIGVSAAFVLSLSVSLRIMVGAVKSMADLNTSELIKGLGGLGVMLVELGIFMRIANGAKLMPTSAVGLVITAGAIKMMVSAIKSMSDINPGILVKGIAAIGGLLLELAIFTRSVSGAKMTGVAVGLLAISVSIRALVGPIKELGNMDLKVLAVGLGSIAVALISIAGAMRLAGGLGGGMGILAVAIAVNLLVPPLKALGETPLEVIGVGLAALAGAFLVIGGAAALMGAASVGLLGFAAGIALVGAAVALVGAGVLMFSTGLTALAALTVTAVTAIVVGLGALLDGISGLIPKVVDLFITLFTYTFEAIDNALPGFLESGVRILTAILTGVRDNIYELATLAVEVISEFARAIGDNAEPLLMTGVQLVVDLVNALANTIREEAPQITNAILNIVESILEIVVLALLQVIAVLFDWIPGVSQATDEMGSEAAEALRSAFNIDDTGEDKAKNFLAGIDGQSGAAKISGHHLGNVPKDAIHGVSGYDTEGKLKGEDFARGIESKNSRVNKAGRGVGGQAKEGAKTIKLNDVGRGMGDGLISGVESKRGGSERGGKGLANSAKEGASSVSLESSGSNLGEGFARGISSKSWTVQSAASGLANMARGAVEKVLAIFSPSRVMRKDGRFFGEGFILGIRDKYGSVKSTASSMAETAREAVVTAASTFNNALLDNLNLNPTITPVLDMDNLQSYDMSDKYSVDVNGQLSKITRPTNIQNLDYFNRRPQDNQNADIVNRNMSNKMDELIETVGNLSDRPNVVEVYMNTKVMADQLSKPIKENFTKMENNKKMITKGRL